MEKSASNPDVVLDKERIDDTAPSSQYDEDEYDEHESLDPLFKYTRMGGSLPRLPKRVGGEGFVVSPLLHPLLASASTCCKMGRVILPPEPLTLDATTEPKAFNSNKSNDLWMKPHLVMAVGFQSGQICFLDAQSALAIIPSEQLKLKESTHQQAVDPIVDVSLDASANFLAAINTTGMCAIWEIKYTSGRTKGTLSPTQPISNTDGSLSVPDNPFASFLSTLAGPAAVATPTTIPVDQQFANNPSILKTLSVQAYRISYPSSFGPPTVLCLDPSYKRRREKAVLVGFADGRLMLTKRGLLFQRRKDDVIYQGSRGTGGIEAIEWRGSLIAWADASGIKIFDVESMIRIAHVERPKGARPSLHPTIYNLKPNLCFETSSNLLVAWGDCVMTMVVKETIIGKTQDSNTLASTGGLPPDAPISPDLVSTIVKRRTVECTMAWELDCIACGVAPLDAEHLVVLGLVPTIDDVEILQREAGAGANDLELQVISRAEGTVIHADVLPITCLPSNAHASTNGVMQESGGSYFLLSSFDIPRMEDTIESEEEGILATDPDFDFNIFASAAKAVFQDSHLKWNMNSVAFEKEEASESKDDQLVVSRPEDTEEEIDKFKNEEDDATSVDSDDYEFIIRPNNSEQVTAATETPSIPPFMVFCSPADIVSIRVKDIDDAISHSLSRHRFGLALHRGLRHRRQLRKHEFNDLVNAFLRAVLRISPIESVGEQKPLSIRRLRLAAAATPTLLGGNVQMWEHWIDEFRRIPGALFILREFIPVRDPHLPAHVYDNVLRTMLRETEEVLSNESKVLSGDATNEATRRFLATLTAWGPTQGLSEKIKFYQYQNEQQSKLGGVEMENNYLEEGKEALARRFNQSAAGYLQLGARRELRNLGANSIETVDATAFGSTDSLFDVDDMVAEVSSRMTILGNAVRLPVVNDLPDNRVAMEALAELHIMMGRYEKALQVFLAVGCLHSRKSIEELENEAVDCVNHWDDWVDNRNKTPGVNPYGFVLSMIEYHHLHQSLLNTDLLPNSDNLSSPLVSLIRLVGLESIGDFLVEHCVPPLDEMNFLPSSIESRTSMDTSDSLDLQEGKEILPLNLVAEQLVENPKLRYWYLHLIFVKRPEMYVSFPTTAVPPREVTELHRAHLDLYIDFAIDRDSAKSLVGTESYNVVQKTTPLLSFLKAALPLGGIRPIEVRRLLEAQREESSGDFPHSFSIELAYVIEHYGKETEGDALTVLDLYLKGASSVTLATSYAQRNTRHTIVLWNTLIQYCLEGNSSTDSREGAREDGALFGSLLESAAVCGADLALLVTRIPQGMNIEGLRPRLVAAVGDYRLKLKMHESASNICNVERIGLLRELTHRSRRGMRYITTVEADDPSIPQKKTPEVKLASVNVHGKNTIERPSRYRRQLSLPMR